MNYKKSSFCAAMGECVEVAIEDDAVLIRNSTSLKEAVTFTRDEWEAFIKGVKNAEFEV